MAWNHRVIKKADEGGEWYAIHEVYYNAKGEPNGATEEAVSPSGSTMDELRAELRMFAEATEKPVLEWAMFEAQEAAARAADQTQS